MATLLTEGGYQFSHAGTVALLGLITEMALKLDAAVLMQLQQAPEKDHFDALT